METTMSEVGRPRARTMRDRSQSSGQDGRTDGGTERLANALGWFSIGLGLAQVVAPRAVAGLIGTEPTSETTRLMRALGLREISSGIGILSNSQPEGWVRARVAGDLMDLALLGRVMTSNDSDRGKTIAATVAVLGVTALDLLAAEKLGKTDTQSRSGTMASEQEKDVQFVRRAITINKSPEEVAQFWQSNGGDEAMLDETVRFVPAPGGRGTEVHLQRTYKSPGRISSVIAKLRHDDPGQHAFDELFALKQILETGDVVTSDAWVNGPHKPHPAQPE